VAGVLSWQHRITRIRERCSDLFGRISRQWCVHRRAYAFHDPQQQTERPSAYQSENQPGTQNQVILGSVQAPARDPDSPLERALAHFAAAVAARKGIEQGNSLRRHNPTARDQRRTLTQGAGNRAVDILLNLLCCRQGCSL